MLPHRQNVKLRSKKKIDNFVAARIRKIEEGPEPDYPKEVDSKENYVYIYIEQHSPAGVQVDRINFYMDKGRMNSWNIKHNGYMQIHEEFNKLFRAGTHRALAWIARNISPNIGRHDG